MTTVLELAERAEERTRARWMPLTSAEFRSLADIAKCMVTVEDLLIVFCGYETCPHPEGCPSAFRCAEFQGCYGRIAKECSWVKVQ